MELICALTSLMRARSSSCRFLWIQDKSTELADRFTNGNRDDVYDQLMEMPIEVAIAVVTRMATWSAGLSERLADFLVERA